MLQRPMHTMLLPLRTRLSLHMPGHRGTLPFGDDACFDTTEIPLTDDLYAPQNGIEQAEGLMAKSAGAAASVFLCGGSTAGIQSVMLMYLKPGDQVILPRNAHHSAIGACVIGGFDAAFAPLTIDDTDYASVIEETFLSAINTHPNAKAIFITRPDYYGGMVDLSRITASAHAKGMKVIVDEAHGAHLNWMPGFQNAGHFGADAWVQSAHKTLPALTPGAVMHFQSAADAKEARRQSRLVQTSSPSFAVLKSIDDARALMDQSGAQALVALVQMTNAFCQKAQLLHYIDMRRDDPTRLVLYAPQGGQALAQSLFAKGIDVEMYDHHRIVCILSLFDTQATFDRLYDALCTIKAEHRSFPLKKIPPLPDKRLSIREAYLAKGEWVPLPFAKGRVAAQSFGLYPPGIPLAVPGEVLSSDMLSFINQVGVGTFGLAADQVRCVEEKG